jgi:hypothetical protein
MKKKPPGQKSVVTGVSLPPDLDQWAKNYARRYTADPTLKSSFSLVVQQDLIEYREKIEREEGKGPLKEAESTDAGAKTTKPYKISATSSSIAGKARFRKAG